MVIIVYAHNIETVEDLQIHVRDRRASFKQSLSVLQHVKKGSQTKSSIMFGRKKQVVSALIELRKNEVDVVTFKGV